MFRKILFALGRKLPAPDWGRSASNWAQLWSGHNVNVGPDLNLVIEFDDMGVVHTKAPVRDGATDRTRSMGAVDPIQRIAKI